jgi:hypothetical protein
MLLDLLLPMQPLGVSVCAIHLEAQTTAYEHKKGMDLGTSLLLPCAAHSTCYGI